MYKDKDPRADLFAAAAKPLATGLVAEEQLVTFYDTPPQDEHNGSRTWYVRGCNFVLAYSETKDGATLERKGQADEYVLYLANPADRAIVEWGGQKVEVAGLSLIHI